MFVHLVKKLYLTTGRADSMKSLFAPGLSFTILHRMAAYQLIVDRLMEFAYAG